MFNGNFKVKKTISSNGSGTVAGLMESLIMPENFENIKMLPNWMMADYQIKSQKSDIKSKNESPNKAREGPCIKIEKLISEEDKEFSNDENCKEKDDRQKRDKNQVRISTVKNNRKQQSGKEIKLECSDIKKEQIMLKYLNKETDLLKVLEFQNEGFQLKLNKLDKEKLQSSQNEFYKRNNSSNHLYESSHSKERMRSSNHISLARKNEKMRKLIKEMNAESIMTERGASNSGVELEIKKCSISNLYVEKNEIQLPRKSSENFSKKLRETLLEPQSARRSGSFKTKYTTFAETPIKYFNMSKRVFYKRRLHMKNKPLIIIYFDGVLGFIAKDNLYFRKGATTFLQNVRHDFQLVMISSFKTKRTISIKDFFEK